MTKKYRKEQNIQHRGDAKDVMKNYDLELRLIRKVPKTYYSKEGTVKTTK